MQTLDKHQRNVRGARPDKGVKRIYRRGGHIIFGLGISGPPQLANFLCGQLKDKKVGTNGFSNLRQGAGRAHERLADAGGVFRTYPH